MNNSLHKQTIDLLNRTDVPLPTIAKETDVGYRWLCDFKAGRFDDPGVNKVERVHNFLVNSTTESEKQ